MQDDKNAEKSYARRCGAIRGWSIRALASRKFISVSRNMRRRSRRSRTASKLDQHAPKSITSADRSCSLGRKAEAKKELEAA